VRRISISITKQEITDITVVIIYQIKEYELNAE
jgi:hypothetical protein